MIFIIQNVDDIHHPARIRKVDRDFAIRSDFKNIQFPVKTREIHKIEKKELYHH